MKSLTKPCLSFEEFLYFAEHGDTFFSLQELFGVPALKLMRDNPAVEKIEVGTAIYVDASQKNSDILLPDEIVDVNDLKEKNDTDFIYPFQRLFR